MNEVRERMSACVRVRACVCTYLRMCMYVCVCRKYVCGRKYVCVVATRFVKNKLSQLLCSSSNSSRVMRSRNCTNQFPYRKLYSSSAWVVL